jgi:glutamine synthetase
MLADITYPDGSVFERDTRSLLKASIAEAEKAGYSFAFGSEQEFYLFELDEKGRPTKTPCDSAGYMDIAPDDRGENVRREICLALEQMGIMPESSHHEEGPGQNEIDFRYSDPLTAADRALTFRTVVKTMAHRNGLHADFSPKPLADAPGNGFHINVSVKPLDGEDAFRSLIAGLLEKVPEMTAFLNPTENSYLRLGENKAPGYVSWSYENRSQLIRIPAAFGEFKRVELRSPDTATNPYLAFSLMINAGLYGLENKLSLCEPCNLNLYTADSSLLAGIKKLPASLEEACRLASASAFIRSCLPESVLDIYCSKA